MHSSQQILLLLLVLLLGACSPAETPELPANDDDSGDEDSDNNPWNKSGNPEPGIFEGASFGSVTLPAAPAQPCEGTATMTLSDEGLVSGRVDCYFAVTDQNCGFDLVDLELDGGSTPLDIECFGEGPAPHSVWGGSATLISGRWMRSDTPSIVEISWGGSPATED